MCSNAIEVERLASTLLGFPAARLVPQCGGVSGGEAGTPADENHPASPSRVSPPREVEIEYLHVLRMQLLGDKDETNQ
jgi:hypothetical protein